MSAIPREFEKVKDMIIDKFGLTCGDGYGLVIELDDAGRLTNVTLKPHKISREINMLKSVAQCALAFGKRVFVLTNKNSKFSVKECVSSDFIVETTAAGAGESQIRYLEAGILLNPAGENCGRYEKMTNPHGPVRIP